MVTRTSFHYRILPFSHLTLTLKRNGKYPFNSFIHPPPSLYSAQLHPIHSYKRIAFKRCLSSEKHCSSKRYEGRRKGGKIRRIRATNKFVLSFVKVPISHFDPPLTASFIAHAFVIVKYVSTSPHSSLQTCACHVNRILFRNA